MVQECESVIVHCVSKLQMLYPLEGLLLKNLTSQACNSVSFTTFRLSLFKLVNKLNKTFCSTL